MDELPLARTTVIAALRYGNDLLIYVEGLTSGFGGKLLVERRPERIFPPEFVVRENPGNSGINPDASPRDVPTTAAFAFPGAGRLDTILFQDAANRRQIPVAEVQSATSDPAPNPLPIPENTYGSGVGQCDWTAVHDLLPPGPGRLWVQGTCLLPTPGYKLSLRRAEPQGFNPRILLLDLETKAPTDTVTQVLTPTPVRFEEETDQRYDQVQIQPEGVVVEIQEVH